MTDATVADGAVRRGDLTVTPVWSDSMGAKTACCLVETPDVAVCVDPGAAAMQPSYPLPDVAKRYLERRARDAVESAVDAADAVVVSHYHYDHYTPDPGLYGDRDLWVKDPNRWINDSQRERSHAFLADLAAARGDLLGRRDPGQREYADPLDDLPRATDAGARAARPGRDDRLAEGRERFRRRVERWREPWLPEPTGVRFADGETFERGDTRIRFSRPLFHGAEYARTGWVVATTIEAPGGTFVHTSDLMGPTVEDYADWLVAQDPDVLFLDGPATYLLGYLLSRTNLTRAVDNAVDVVRRAAPDLTIWDHHPLRDSHHRERTAPFWALREEGFDVRTVAELHGQAPLIDRLTADDGVAETLRAEAEAADRGTDR